MVDTWLGAFVATVLLETPVVVTGTARVLGWWSLPVAFGLQVVTHPALWFVMPRFSPYWLWVGVAETLVISIEAVLLGVVLWRTGQAPRRAAGWALLVSLAANTLSTVVGLLLRW